MAKFSNVNLFVPTTGNCPILLVNPIGNATIMDKEMDCVGKGGVVFNVSFLPMHVSSNRKPCKQRVYSEPTSSKLLGQRTKHGPTMLKQSTLLVWHYLGYVHV